MSVWSRLANLLRTERLQREIEEELGTHLQEAIEEGRDPEEVQRAFGSFLRYREQSREVKLVVWMDSLRADLIFGWRQLCKRPAILSITHKLSADLKA